MTKLLPCPFCGGRAERIDIEAGENAGGSCVCCTVCEASGSVEFGRKENFVANWNRRANPSGFALVPAKMTAAMINAWGGGLTVTTDEIAYRTTFQEAWGRVLAASETPSPEPKAEGRE